MVQRHGRVAFHTALEPEKWADMEAFLAELSAQTRRGRGGVSEVMRRWRQKRLTQL